MRSSSIPVLEGLFIWNICIVEFDHVSLSLKLEYWLSGCWHILFLTFVVFFHSCIGGHFHLKHLYGWIGSHELKSKIWGKSDRRLLRYTIFVFEVFFNWRSSYLKYFYSLLWSHELKSKIEEYWTSGCCNFPFLIFEVFHHMYNLRSQKLKFKFWGRLDQWLLRYSIFNIWGLLPLFHWSSSSSEIIVKFGHISLSLKYGEDRTSFCWDIPFLIFEVFFHY